MTIEIRDGTDLRELKIDEIWRWLELYRNAPQDQELTRIWGQVAAWLDAEVRYLNKPAKIKHVRDRTAIIGTPRRVLK